MGAGLGRGKRGKCQSLARSGEKTGKLGFPALVEFVWPLPIMSELFIRQEILKNLPSLDCLLFDMDGVLLDVSQSFRAAIIDTTQFYLKEQLGLEDTGPLIEADEIELFKFAGGFNDDWDLTNAVVALLLGKWAQSGAKDTKTLREFGTTWREFT